MNFEGMNIKKIMFVLKNKTKSNKIFSCSNRNSFGIVYKKSGVSKYIHNSKTYLCNPGSIIFIPADIGYKIEYFEDGEFIMANFTVDTEKLFENLFVFTPVLPSEFEDIFYGMYKAWNRGGSGDYWKAMSHLCQIFCKIEEQTAFAYMPKQKMKYIDAAVRYINEHYWESELGVETLAKELHISVSYLRMLFNSYFKTSPIKYIQKKRITKAKELLESELYTISEVSRLTGYDSIYYFSYAFKKIVGLTPTEYISYCNELVENSL